MSVEKTNEWLEDHFMNPTKICRDYIIPTKKDEANKLYNYLLSFGMYRPNRSAKEKFVGLKKEEIWSKVAAIYESYQKKWNGPDIPIYIFPISNSRNNKSGVSFENKIFLFIDRIKDDKELEALIIHEYHHVCRMNKLDKPLQDYTLLDSMVMEGLAEYAVTKYCGNSYNAKWLTYYTKEEIKQYWKRYLVQNIDIKRTEKLHDALLFGKGFIPVLLGYAAGYYLIMNRKGRRDFSIQETFSLQAKEIADFADIHLIDLNPE